MSTAQNSKHQGNLRIIMSRDPATARVEAVQASNVTKMIKGGGKQVLMAWIVTEYEKKHGSKLVYSGKFKDYIETIPGVKVQGAYVAWVGVGAGASTQAPHTNVPSKKFDCAVCGISGLSKIDLDDHNRGKKHKKKVASQGPKGGNNAAPYPDDAVSATNSKQSTEDKKKGGEMKIAVHDGLSDILSFKESLGGKSPQNGNESAEEVGPDLLAGFESMSLSEKSAALDEAALSLFVPKLGAHDGLLKNKGMSLFSSANIDKHSEGALFGHLLPSSTSEQTAGDGVYLNTHEPFCFITVGVQGAGKSHTSSCVLESCLVPFGPGKVVKLNAPQTCMVLHYDQNITSICEAAGLLSPNPSIKAKMSRFGHDVSAVQEDKAVILVSPAFYKQRKKFYGDGLCTVKPLLFRWKSLTADHIKRIMRIESGDNQLYVASFLELLRGYQRKGATLQLQLPRVRS